MRRRGHRKPRLLPVPQVQARPPRDQPRRRRIDRTLRTSGAVVAVRSEEVQTGRSNIYIRFRGKNARFYRKLWKKAADGKNRLTKPVFFIYNQSTKNRSSLTSPSSRTDARRSSIRATILSKRQKDHSPADSAAKPIHRFVVEEFKKIQKKKKKGA